MQLGIQRRGLCLAPPVGLERHWVFQQLDRPEVFEMFGLVEAGARAMRRMYQLRRVALGVMRLVENNRRVGFAALFVPSAANPFWEFSYAIPDARDRDAYTALNTMDAMAWYAFEHLGVPSAGGRTREDNHAAQAIVRRAGHRLTHTAPDGGHAYHFYALDRLGWSRRRERLERGELAHPSPGGAAFVVLPKPPYAPVRRPLVPGGTPLPDP